MLIIVLLTELVLIFLFDLSDLSLWGASLFPSRVLCFISWLRLRPQILMSSLLNLFHSGLQAVIAFLTVVWTPTDNVCCSPTPQKPWKRQDTRVIGNWRPRTSVVIQWLRLHLPNAGYMGSILVRKLRSYILWDNRAPAPAVKTQHSQIQSINQSINFEKNPKQLGTPTILWGSNPGSATSYPITLYKLPPNLVFFSSVKWWW